MPELHYIGISAAFDPTDEGDNPACSKCNDRLSWGNIMFFDRFGTLGCDGCCDRLDDGTLLDAETGEYIAGPGE